MFPCGQEREYDVELRAIADIFVDFFYLFGHAVVVDDGVTRCNAYVAGDHFKRRRFALQGVLKCERKVRSEDN